ncbi:SAM-dependent methyltransferase [Siculibacillus lacustris]|uniref:SAM-dependent methyltransferase n=1 Tax=Siculibacillus lacustris TaxID=1549641 RepID=A0A4Q9VL18_9HYPH|nr:class I SAM-dependent methyltransferase [Siculibacillus lacustris]TBW36145.1 SAM-dependent methyltransferase [Siculibacillus lacustris]
MSHHASVHPAPRGPSRPSPWVLRFLAGAPAGGPVLDVACGGGRHLRAALDRDHPVVGLDRDLGGVADLAGRPDVTLVATDLEAPDRGPWPVTGRRFAAVVITKYLYRPLFPEIRAAVADDGVLIYETFARGQPRHGHPARDVFLLGPNELLAPALIDGLVVVAFEQGEIPADPVTGRIPEIVQRLCAVGPAHPWVLERPRPID